MIFLPARDSAIPILARGKDLSLANGLTLGSSYGTIPLGAGAFGLASAFAGGAAFTVTFAVDAFSFLVSFALLSRIESLSGVADADVDHDDAEEPDGGFLQSLRLPLVRVVAPTAVVVSLGLGALFSIGITYVRDVLEAGTAGFSILVVLFGAGAGVGLVVLHLFGKPDLATVRWTVAAQGAVVAGMSQAPHIAVAFIGAVLFGATTAVALTSAMTVLQERLDGQERVLAFTAFHVLIRVGLAVSALAAGAVGDLVGSVRWPLVGTLPPARLVLLLSGLLVVATAGLSHQLSDRPDASEPA